MKVVEDFFIYKITIENEDAKKYKRHIVASDIEAALLIAKEWFKDEYILSIKEIAPSMASQIDSKERVWDI